MPLMRQGPVGNLDAVQAIELSLLVDLEALWENLRKTPPGDSGPGATTRELQGKQKAYDAFRAKLVAYNNRYTPPHVPELLLNTPSRLDIWCQAMRRLYLKVEHDPRGHCPVHLLEKAYRWADRISSRTETDRIGRSSLPRTIGAVIGQLEALGQWCDNLANVVGPGLVGV